MDYIVSVMIGSVFALIHLIQAKSGVAFLGVLFGLVLLTLALPLLYPKGRIPAAIISGLLLLGQVALYAWYGITFASLAPVAMGMAVVSAVELGLLLQDASTLSLVEE